MGKSKSSGLDRKKTFRQAKREMEQQLRSKKKRYAATNFLFLTYGLCWVLAFAFQTFGLEYKGVAAMILGTLYMFIPAGVTLLIYNKNITQFINLNLKPNRWFLVASLLPAALVLASLYASTFINGVEFTTDLTAMAKNMSPYGSEADIQAWVDKVKEGPVHYLWIALAQGIVMGATLNAFFALGEELGWRGLLFREWQYMGFWKQAAAVGVVWGLWHAPLIYMGHNYPNYPVLGIGMMIVFCVLISPLIQWVRLQSGGVASAAIFHGTINGLAGLGILMLSGGSELTNGLLGIAGFFVLAVANSLLALFWRPEAKSAQA